MRRYSSYLLWSLPLPFWSGYIAGLTTAMRFVGRQAENIKKYPNPSNALYQRYSGMLFECLCFRLNREGHQNRDTKSGEHSPPLPLPFIFSIADVYITQIGREPLVRTILMESSAVLRRRDSSYILLNHITRLLLLLGTGFDRKSKRLRLLSSAPFVIVSIIFRSESSIPRPDESSHCHISHLFFPHIRPVCGKGSPWFFSNISELSLEAEVASSVGFFFSRFPWFSVVQQTPQFKVPGEAVSVHVFWDIYCGAKGRKKRNYYILFRGQWIRSKQTELRYSEKAPRRSRW
eukprot:284815753_4